jgi:hypothetical protein
MLAPHLELLRHYTLGPPLLLFARVLLFLQHLGHIVNNLPLQRRVPSVRLLGLRFFLRQQQFGLFAASSLLCESTVCFNKLGLSLLVECLELIQVHALVCDGPVLIFKSNLDFVELRVMLLLFLLNAGLQLRLFLFLQINDGLLVLHQRYCTSQLPVQLLLPLLKRDQGVQKSLN